MLLYLERRKAAKGNEIKYILISMEVQLEVRMIDVRPFCYFNGSDAATAALRNLGPERAKTRSSIQGLQFEFEHSRILCE
jgi:hypothetical protein